MSKRSKAKRAARRREKERLYQLKIEQGSEVQHFALPPASGSGNNQPNQNRKNKGKSRRSGPEQVFEIATEVFGGTYYCPGDS